MSKIETLKKLDLAPGDILHVQVGMELGDSMSPWIPTHDDLCAIRSEWELVLPDDVKLICSHCGIDEVVIRRLSQDVTHWPPRTP